MLQLLSATLTKSFLILEDKIIVENALSILVGTLLFKAEIYPKFTNFKSESGIRDAEQLILTGLFNDEEKVRIDFENSLNVMSTNLQDEHNALNFLLAMLARNFSKVSNKPSRQFFELFNRLIDLKARRDDSSEEQSEVYNPEELLNQTIDKIKQ